MTYDGLAPADLAARLRAPGCLSLASVTSTMDIAHGLAAEGAPAGSVVLADEQVVGRGRQGRRWHSPAGSGIWLSYLLRPTRSTEGGVLALRVGLAVTDALAEVGAAARLKWPNDVLLEDRKLAGVLCEARWAADRLEWVAVGVGINVRGTFPPEIAPRAIALCEVVPSVTRLAVLEALVPRLHRLPDLPQLSEGERAAYQRVDWLAGRALDQPVRGRALGVDASGALLVETGRGTQRVLGGGVVCS
ncbi:MAG: biotin--[acetyl-CoA-carboxylase] ligase [Gemmatimonadetes bacterium]|nr:biotin--[acetyl-CoA-carboxylase] ligase [Gemmatimonadota bacterium]